MGHSMEFEMWRERRREMLREAEQQRLGREARSGQRMKLAGSLRGFGSVVAGVFRRPALRGGSVAVARSRRCEE